MPCPFPQIVLNVAYTERADVFSFGFTLLEIVLGDCTYVQKHFKGQYCVVSRAKGGLGWRPPVPYELTVSLPDVASLFADCVVDDFHERPSFVEVCERLWVCKEGEFCAPPSAEEEVRVVRGCDLTIETIDY